MSDFQLLKVLGTGAYGKVFLVRKITGRDRGKLYAMKVLKKATLVQKQKTLEHALTERQVLESIRQNPFLVTLHYAFQTDAKLHLILDYVSGGELFTHLFNQDHFSEPQVQIYMAEIILALEKLHSLGIIYRDLKLENVLIDADGHIVLTDFGLCKEFLPHDQVHRAYSFCGTIEYMAPEVMKGGNAGHDYCADWWSVGVLTHELLTGASPFAVSGKLSQQDVQRSILKDSPSIAPWLSTPSQDFIRRLLVKDPKLRLGAGADGAQQLKSHPFFQHLCWQAVAAKQVPAPIVPKISGELDVSNFAQEFTSMAPEDSPAVAPPASLALFQGYSFVAPSILFGNNAIMGGSGGPALADIMAAKFKKYSLVMKDGLLGDGSFSVCRRCVHKASGKEFTVKIVSRKQDCSREVAMLKRCQGHPNIVNFHRVYQDEAHTYIVMELLRGGELFERIRQKKRFTECEAVHIFRQLVSAVHHIHSRGVIHRDLKPENLVFVNGDEPGVVKVVDFGFARPRDTQPVRTPCFTLQYAAPEVLTHALEGASDDGYSDACDLWSLGVILYAMLSGKTPFQLHSRDVNAATIMQRIREGRFNFTGPQWSSVSTQAQDVILGLLTVEPHRRLGLSQLWSHSWLRGRRHPRTPLMSPTVMLGTRPRATEQAIRTAMDAFHRATLQGFRLLDVDSAPLARRRRRQLCSQGEGTYCSSSSSISPPPSPAVLVEPAFPPAKRPRTHT
ncbi:RPS6KA5 [Cordylochernes scorpioides]|uniref:Ribosomal protein S6 kinase n=1 Tax=Cordylochernes scorpioides TaxID=51811 RepID=A0ABY6K9A8_9ARAC|nr:RPS6KA5 [Cordylochernes scorpioides]